MLGLLLRGVQLEWRPMHGDEAVNAAKLDALLTTGRFEYNPAEYHGPTLYYFSYLVFKLLGKHQWQALTASDLRWICVLFGVFTIALPLLLRRWLNARFLLLAMLFLALSPPLVFFSRYFIHETLFVFFLYLSFFSLVRTLLQNSSNWALVAGLAFGAVLSTKETWPLLVVALILAFALLPERQRLSLIGWRLRNGWWFVFATLFFLLMLFSDFFRDFQGLLAFARSFFLYAGRATEGNLHVHPFGQYVQWLMFYRAESAWWSSQLAFGLLITVSMVLLFKKQKRNTGETLLLWLGSGALLCALFFSLIPYKTPWNVLPFWTALVMVAAYSLSVSQLKLRFVGLFLVLLVSFTLVQNYWVNFRKACSPQNPFVYAHPGREMLKLSETLQQWGTQSPQNRQTYLQVIVPKNDYWPLPWYLRHFEKVGWWAQVPENVQPAPLIIADVSLQQKLTHYLYEKQPPGQRRLYLPRFARPVPLRPGGPKLQLYVRYDFAKGVLQP